MMKMLSDTSAAAVLIAFAAGLAPVVSFFVPRAVSPLVILTVAAALALMVWRKQRLGRPIAPLFVILFLFWVWAALSIAWSLDTWLAVRGTLKLAGNLALGALLLTIARQTASEDDWGLGYFLGGGFGLAFVLLGVDGLFGTPISRLILDPVPNVSLYGYFWLHAGATMMCLLVWPLLLIALRRRRGLAAFVLFLATLALIYLLQYRAGILSLLIGGVIAVVTYFARRYAIIFSVVVFAVGTLSAPWAVEKIFRPDLLAGASESVQQATTHRLYIWKFTADRIAEHALRGWGINASRTIPGGKDPARHPTRGYLGENLPLHPHSLVLQVWLELGLPGALGLVAFVAMAILRLGRAGVAREVSAIGLGQGAAAFVIGSVSYGIWQSWWLAALWLAAATTTIAATASMSREGETDPAVRLAPPSADTQDT